MSSRQKQKIRDRVATRVLNGKATPAEGRRALKAAGVKVKGQKAAAAPQAGRTGTGTVYKSYGAAPAPEQPSLVQVYAQHSDPQLREALNDAYSRRRTT
jgi:hypothetical protein